MSELLLVTSHFLPNDGGIARLMTELYQQLDRQGTEFKVLCLEKKFKQPERKITQIKGTGFRQILRAILFARQHKGIHLAALWYPDGLISFFTKARKKIVLVHGTEILPNINPLKEFFQSYFRKKVLEQANLLIVNSSFTEKLLRQNYSVKKTVCIHPGTDISRFTLGDKLAAKNRFETENKLVLSTLSVIRKHKGLEIIFEALSGLAEDIKRETVLLIGGTGDALTYYQDLAEKLEITSSLRWLGYVEEEVLPDFYRASDLFLLTSYREKPDQGVEGFGMVLTEAQACGTPVVGTAEGGIVDAVSPGEGGWLLQENYVDELKGLIEYLYYHPNELEEQGKAARRRIEQGFTWERYYSKLIKALDSLKD